MISKAKLNINIISNKLSSKKDIYIMNIAVHYQLSIIHYTLRRNPFGLSAEGVLRKSGGYLLSHGCAVPSAQAGLTSLFGMGRGGTPPL